MMVVRRLPFLLAPLATAASMAAAQTTTLSPVVIQGLSPASVADVSGFGDIALSRSPVQARVVGTAELRDLGGSALRDLTRLDASLGDAYNAEGYWDQLSARGFTIDNRNNYRRDGLPINAETSIALDNKAKIEVLKGLSGLQAGTSAPGGLVNLVVKRPDGDMRHVSLETSGRGTVTAAVDLSSRFGAERAFGLRINAAAAHIQPELHDAQGHRELVALAGDWQLSTDTLLEAEFEHSRRSQPSQPGFSLLGDRVPDANDIDPRTNLNAQPWTTPVVLRGETVSLRWTHRLTSDWRVRLHGALQSLHSDDRAAFPFGCYDAGTDIYYADGYCPDGRFDLYDYRSDNERRRTAAFDASLQGRLQSGDIEHRLTVGVLRTRFKARFEQLAYNSALVGGIPGGQGSIDGNLITEPDPTLTADNANRDDRSTEFYLRDAMRIGDRYGLWLGLRHTRLERDSITTSGTEATHESRNVTTPWIAATVAPSAGTMLYASWGRGIESTVTPNLPRYTNAGASLPTLKSTQTELGLKFNTTTIDAGIAVFDIKRPATSDIGADCSFFAADDSCTRVMDGNARHRGVELHAQWAVDAWTLGTSIQWLRARREGSADDTLNGTRPPNVPSRSLRLMASHAFSDSTDAYAALTAESNRTVRPGDDSPRIPGWARIDLGAHHEQRLASGTTLRWRAGIDNVANRRAWREAPYQFEHVYLYPLAPRTWRASVQAEF